MTVAAEEHVEQEQQLEKVKAVRRFDTEIAAGDGRTVMLRVAPFGDVAVSADGLGGSPKGVRYEERLAPGLYDHQLRAANRIFLNFEHQPGLQGVVGHGVELRRESDGYHGAFRVHETPDGDKALMLVKEGVLAGASVESFWLKSEGLGTGRVLRTRGQLDAVALCRQGAYPSAGVTGLRTEDMYEEEFVLDESLLPVAVDPELLVRAERLGITLPASMKPAAREGSEGSEAE